MIICLIESICLMPFYSLIEFIWFTHPLIFFFPLRMKLSFRFEPSPLRVSVSLSPQLFLLISIDNPEWARVRYIIYFYHPMTASASIQMKWNSKKFLLFYIFYSFHFHWYLFFHLNNLNLDYNTMEWCYDI